MVKKTPETGTPHSAVGSLAWGTGQAVDTILAEHARPRLALAALCLGALSALVALITQVFLVSRVGPDVFGGPFGRAWGVVDLGVGLATAALARSERVTTRGLVALGVAYQLYACLTISVRSTHESLLTTGALPDVTWVAVVIVFFPLLMPSTPRLAMGVGLACASSRGLAAVFVSGASGVPLPPSWGWAVTLSPAAAVFLGLASARVVHGLGMDVAKAHRLGSYQLEKILGRGGMGEVWQAKHQLLARPAAIKLIRKTPSDGPVQHALEHFEWEARATATLVSQHTVHLYDFGMAPTGQLYYAMELLSGLNLEAFVLRYGPMEPARVVEITRQICRSLEEAHANGLVHRDIKPSNIMLCRYGSDFDFVKVLDFGLVTLSTAHPATLGSAPATDMTDPSEAGRAVGTPGYMSPEAAQGLQVDERADVYGVGCVMFWLLTGQLVFPAKSVRSQLEAHVGKKPPDLRKMGPQSIPSELAAIVGRCLSKEAVDRPTAEDLRKQLKKVESGARWSDTKARRWWETHRPLEVLDERAPEQPL